MSREHPKHAFVLYAASSFFSILVIAPYKWDKKWMRIRTSVGIVVFGASLMVLFALCLDLLISDELCRIDIVSIALNLIDRISLD